MKMKKILIALGLILSLLLSGCDYQAIVEDYANKLVHQMTEPEDVVEPFIGFSETEVDDSEQLRQLQPEELQNYTSRYSDYNTYTYFEHLNDAEKLLYHAYEYALDEALPCFWIDDRLLEGMNRTAFEVLEFFSLDSAVVEQNFSLSSGGYDVTHSILNVETARESYTTIYVDDFTREKLQHKEEAIAKAKEILSALPAEATARETAEYFFDYLGKNVIYEADIPAEEYLYAALCLGKTNCDGYTNAFALLCSMAHISCIEIDNDAPEGEEGHTWNMVYLEDRWVHVDATAAEYDVTAECENRRQERIYFGFPDELLEDRIMYADLLPSCPEGLTPVLHIPSGDAVDFTQKVKQSFRENDRKVAVILVDEGDLEDQITEDLATELECDLEYVYYETVEGKMVYYLFNGED